MQSGQVIVGKYRLNQLLGTGGMAEVWSATNVFTEREFAVKFMSPEVAKTPEHAARFLKEAKVSARVNHPNIIEIIDVGQTDDQQLFMVMELLSGVPLEVAMRRQTPRMTIPEFVFVMTEVASALAAAHRAGVIHRDLKPSNIYLHRDKNQAAVPKVLDFGVSKFLDDGAPSMALTMAGTVLGSPLYMSPEQARGDGDLDGRTDIFAFGAILFEGLSGMRPYEAANFNALIVKIATTAPRDIDDFAPDVPAPLRDVVKLCLEPDRNKRVAMFETVAEQLMNILPDLEREPAHLPAPMTILSTDDPDATNALPIVRAGDRPQSVPPPAQLPAPHFAAWQSPAASLSLTTAPTSIAPPAPRPAQQPAVYAMGAAAAAVILALLIVLVTVLRREPRIITVTGDPRPTPSAGASAPASAAPSSSIPMVNVDTLPMAAKPSIPLEKGRGRLIVSASPGWCIVTVDGVSKGPTPLPALDLSAGTHHLRCEAPGKKPKTVSLIITEAAAANYKFTID